MKKLSNGEGFTLVEVLVAITLMAVGILAVVQMQIVGMKSGTLAQRQTVATNIAKQVMEDIQSWDKDNLPAFAPANAFTTGVSPWTTPEQWTGPINFLTNPNLNTSRDQTLLSFSDSGTFRAYYSITINENTAVIRVKVEQRLPDGQFQERLRLTSVKNIIA